MGCTGVVFVSFGTCNAGSCTGVAELPPSAVPVVVRGVVTVVTAFFVVVETGFVRLPERGAESAPFCCLFFCSFCGS